MDPLYKMWKNPFFEVKLWSKVRVWSDEIWIIKDLDDINFDIISDKDESIEKRNFKPFVYDNNNDFTEKLDSRKIDYIICGYNLAENRELFEINFEHDKGNISNFIFEKWSKKEFISLSRHKLKNKLSKLDLEKVSNFDLIIEIVKISQKSKIIKEMNIINNIEVVADKLNREQFLEFLWLK